MNVLTKNIELVLEEASCCVCGSNKGEIIASGRDFEYNTCSNTFTFKECGVCGLWYLTPRPRIGDLNIIYPYNYYAYDEKSQGKKTLTRFVWDRLEKGKINKLAKLIQEPEGAHILELGCANGRFLHLLRRYLPETCKISGVEIDQRAAELAAQIDGVDIYHGFFEDMDFEPDSLDLIIAQQLIEHVPEPRKIIEKAFGFLKPGGAIVLETPNIIGLDRRIFSKRYWGGYHFPRHFNIFSEDTLRQLCKQCGFSRTSSISLISATFWITTVRNIISDHWGLKKQFSWIHIYNPLLLGITTTIELVLNIFRIPSSNMQFIARK